MSNWLIDEENISSSWIDAKNRYCGLERYLVSGIIKGKYHMKIVFTLVKISYSIKNKIDITLQSSSTGYPVWIINMKIILMKKHLIFFDFWFLKEDWRLVDNELDHFSLSLLLTSRALEKIWLPLKMHL